MNSKIKYREGFKLLLQKVHPDLQLTKSALYFLENIFNDVNDAFIGECLKSSRDDTEIKLTTVARVVDEQLEGNMMHHARAEGNKAIFKYNTGVLHFKPKTTPKEEPRREKRQLRNIFSEGIIALCSLFREASLSIDARNVLCRLLEKLSETISNKAKQGSEYIDEKDVRRAVANVIPGQMCSHAFAEGQKVIMLAKSKKYVEKILMPSDKRKRVKRLISEKEDRPVKKRRMREKIAKSAPRVSRRKPPKKEPVKMRREEEKEVVIPTSKRISKRKSSRKPPVRKRRIIKKVDEAAKRRKSSRRKRVQAKSERKKSVRRRRVSKVPKVPPKRIRKSRKKAVKTVSTARRKSTKEPLRRRISERTATAKAASKRMRSKRRKAVRRRTEDIKFAFLETAVKGLNSLFNQALSSDALRIICKYLSEFIIMMFVAINKEKFSIVGPKEIRYVVQRVFPQDLQETAIARLSQVAARIHCRSNYC